jgi:BirA family transcriptional regulator, biotin operon repressor / biotin---[acetyl-CoA-carboxylase] ligase
MLKPLPDGGSIVDQPLYMVVENVLIRWFQFDTVISTMDTAVECFRHGAAPWTMVSANRQTGGRGTKGRTWISSDGRGLWFSIILPVPECLDMASNVTLQAAEALVETLGTNYGICGAIKYPNDVLVNEKKIAGILVESVTAGEKPCSMILGMGVNLFQNRHELDDAGLADATSVALETDTTPNAVLLLKSFLGSFIRHKNPPVHS